MIGARDMAFPRLNALSYWIFLASGVFLYASFALGDGAERRLVRLRAARARRRTTRAEHRLLRARADLQRDLASTLAAVNFIVTIFKLRAPGMSLNRMPLFCFALLARRVRARSSRCRRSRSTASSSCSTASSGFHFFDVAARRRPAALAAPVLDLRPPRGLHHRPAGVRDRDVDHPDVRAAPDGRLPARRDRRAARRVHRLRRLGAPHVRDRAADDHADLLRRRER